MTTPPSNRYDIAIVGGGVNGCGIARDAARRGLRVLLCESGDLACSTSSASTKLIHGGLRYLEHGDFALVRESLSERERLLRIAPHIIWPMRFVLVHVEGLRPYWKIRIGLALYDLLAKRDILPPCKAVDLTGDEAGKALKDRYRRAFEYSDCWVDDARLVVLNALDAKEHGATILTNTKLGEAKPVDGRWQVRLEGDHAREIEATVVVNASGPWASELRSRILDHSYIPASATRLVQGSHIVLPRIFDHDRAYILQGDDKRVVFALPYQGKFTLVGTTDREFDGDPGEVAISDEETQYLLGCANNFFDRQVTKDDICWSYSGVRGLFDDGAKDAQEVSRDYVIKVDPKPSPLVNILGGKLTTYRRLSVSAVDMCRPWMENMPDSDTGNHPLPGGDIAIDGVAQLAKDLEENCKGLGAQTAMRLARSYGSRATAITGDAKEAAQLGEDFGGGLYEAELEHLAQNEWAKTAEDVLTRRTKLCLELDDRQQQRVAKWLEGRP